MSSSGEGSSQWIEPTKNDKPPKDADLAEAWAFLGQGVEHIMTRLNTGMSYSYYILLYTTIYDFCTQHRPFGAHDNYIRAFGSPRSGASLQGADLYRSLNTYLLEHSKKMRQETEKLSDIDLLKAYAKRWEQYTQGATYVNKLFNYLNKHWVKREKDEGRKEVYTVYTLALVSWKANFFKHLQADHNKPSRLTQALLRQIELHRNGEAVDSSLLKRVIDSYVSLGLDEADAQRQNLDVYKSCFQTFFLQATDAFYKAESEEYISVNSVSDYMKKAESRLQEEMDRVTLYLHDHTRSELKAVCERVLIADYRTIMTKEFQVLLDNDRISDLARMYNLLMRITGGLEPLRRLFEEHVKKAGLAAVQRILPAPGASTETADDQDPRAYIEALLEVHSKYDDVVNGPFKAEIGFNGSLDRACREFVNTNAAATTPTKSPELLASYCDLLLKKSNKDLDADALEQQLSKAMLIFRFIDDKDVYQKFYQKKLCARLVNGLSTSDDSESSMINKLKELSGYDYTQKLTKMFTDVNLSRDLTEKFRDRCKSDLDMDVSMLVLGTNSWPMVPQQTDFAVPREVQDVYDRFNKFHSDVHSGRKLTWLWHVSKNELKTTYLPQRYIFMTSSYQMAILTQFNESDSITYNDILLNTKLAEGILKPQLSLLVKAKVLLHDETTNLYDLNLNFKSKKIRVQLNQPVRAEQKAETTDVLHQVDEDRKFVYQATIVRLMKARKTMKHQALIQEVTSLISTKFTPKVPEIKKAIDHLIDKEYLERSAESNDTYQYLA
ncbi:Cullin 1 [Tremella mesenterica]|uniref:Cullin-1 n=1 Tax=Tremella mesenterica TaxID=5217 RepID=A0A4Q1BTU7_TREME|nr:Cullin 1 [Tremella mesenterica]